VAVFAGDGDYPGVVRAVATTAFAVVVGGGRIEACTAVVGIATRSAFFFRFRLFGFSSFFGEARFPSFYTPGLPPPGFSLAPRFKANPLALSFASRLRLSPSYCRLAFRFLQFPLDLGGFLGFRTLVGAASRAAHQEQRNDPSDEYDSLCHNTLHRSRRFAARAYGIGVSMRTETDSHSWLSTSCSLSRRSRAPLGISSGSPRSGKGISTRSKSRGAIVGSKTSRASSRTAPTW